MEPTSFSSEKTRDWTEVMSDLRGRVRGRHEVCLVPRAQVRKVVSFGTLSAVSGQGLVAGNFGFPMGR